MKNLHGDVLHNQPIAAAGILFLALLALVLFPAAGATAAGGATETVSGIVFHDRTGTGLYDPSADTPLPGIAVSNGRDVVETDERGRYELPLGDHAIVFVIKPPNWAVPVDDQQIPRFWYIHNPRGATGKRYAGLDPTGPLPGSVDFPLLPANEPEQFDVLVFADTQPRDLQEIGYLARDAVAGLVGSDAAFGVTLGDIVFDDLDLFGPVNETVASIGIPWRHVIGNHDLDFSADDNTGARGAYYRHYGPSYYAFSYGPAHFLVVDNNRFVIDGDNRYYRPELCEDQLTFIQNELARIDKNKLLVVLMHIPWDDGGWNREQRTVLMELLAEHPRALSLGAHWHRHYHRFLGEEYGFPGEGGHHMVSVGAVCGAWWRGIPDEYGVPHAMMSDGTPAGYGILHVDGRDARLHWQPSRRRPDFQMHIHVPDDPGVDVARDIAVTANVFNALPDARVEMRIGTNGEWTAMDRIEERDPVRLAAAAFDASVNDMVGADGPWMEMGGTAHTYTLWQGRIPGPLPAGTHVLQVRSEDRWWVHEGNAVIRVTR